MADERAEDALAQGEAARRARRFEDAEAGFAEAVAQLGSTGSPDRLAHALSRWAQIARDRGDFAAAAQRQGDALALARANSGLALGPVLRHHADILTEAGRLAEAAPLFDELLALYRSTPATPPLELANAVRAAAVHAQASGDPSRAIALWREARDRYASLDELFHSLTGQSGNPGVEEADRRLQVLAGPITPED